MLKKINTKTFMQVNTKNIFARQIYIYKNQKVIDIDIYKTESYFMKKSDWDENTVFLYTNVLNTIQNFYLINPDKYQTLYQSYMIKTEQKEHTIKNFSNLINNFDLNLLEKNKIQISHMKNKIFRNYVIVDGLHRLAIYMNKYDDKKINKIYLNIN